MERWCLVPWFWICFSWGVGYTESRQRSEEWALECFSLSSWGMEEIRRGMEEIRRGMEEISEEWDPQKFRKIHVIEVSWKKYLRRRAGSTVSNVKSWVEWGLRIDRWIWQSEVYWYLWQAVSLKYADKTRLESGLKRKWKSRTEESG